MSIIQDYRRFAIAEESKHFSFKPDTMIQNPDEFRDALIQYAEENHFGFSDSLPSGILPPWKGIPFPSATFRFRSAATLQRGRAV